MQAREIETSASDDKRFWARIDREASGCWEWPGAISGDGYGRFYVGRRQIRAHRYAFKAEHGFDAGDFLCHGCGNRLCVRPGHLYNGTPKTNTDDRDQHGRTAKGEAGGNTRLSESQVRMIRDHGQVSAEKLASLLGVCATTVWNVRAGKTWGHLV